MVEYLEDIKEDVDDMINSMIDHNYGFKVGVNRIIFENDLYMSDEKPVEMACYYIAIGAYTVITNNIENLDLKVLDKIKQSYYIIKSGEYDKYFTEEDKIHINRDINFIEDSTLFK